MKKIVVFIIGVFSVMSFSQESLNNHTYIVVPKKFDVFKIENQFKTSTLLKYLFTEKGFAQNGFTIIYDDNLPSDLVQNRCLALYTDLTDSSSLFITKAIVTLTDCQGKEVYKTQEGTSRKKEFEAAFKEAITVAMRSFNDAKWRHKNPSVSYKEEKPLTLSFKNDIKDVDGAQKGQKEAVSKSEKEPKKPLIINKEVAQKATETTQLYKDATPVGSMVKKGETRQKINTTNFDKQSTTNFWYAQPIANGYQLVDTTPSVRMRILNSSDSNTFFAQTDETCGLVFKKDTRWIFEYYENEKLIQQEVHIKF